MILATYIHASIILFFLERRDHASIISDPYLFWGKLLEKHLIHSFILHSVEGGFCCLSGMRGLANSRSCACLRMEFGASRHAVLNWEEPRRGIEAHLSPLPVYFSREWSRSRAESALGYSGPHSPVGTLSHNGFPGNPAEPWRSQINYNPQFMRRVLFRGLSTSPVRAVWCSASVADSLPANNNGRKAAEKFEFDNIQDLIVSPPSVSASKALSGQPPTLLEREAEALEGSTVFSLQERIEAMSGLLDHLEQKGVTPGYAFEFVRHAGNLIDDLFVEAKAKPVKLVGPLNKYETFSRGVGAQHESASSAFRAWPSSSSSSSSSSWNGTDGDSTAEIEREKKINLLLQISDFSELEIDEGKAIVFPENSTLASRVFECAEKRGLGRLVSYFQIIGVKAQNVPRMLPFLEQGIEMVMAKVGFLRSLGVKYNHLPGILVRWPELLSFESDSLAQSVDYLVGLGLAHNDIGKMVIKFPQILGRHVEKELRKSVELLAHLGVPLKDVKKLVVRYPVLLTEHASEKLDPLVTYLQQLGVRREHTGIVLLRRPRLLDSDVEKDLVPIGNYLMSLNASADDIDKILMSFPQLFGYDVEQDFHPTVLYLESLGIESLQMGKLFRRHPQLLKNRLNFELKLEFLQSLGLLKKDLGKVIYNAPQLLGLSVRDNMEPTVKFLASIGIKGPSLLKVLKLKPMILAHSVEGKLKPNIKFLESLELKEEEIGKLVTRYPQLLTLSVEKNLTPTVTYLLNLGFTRAEVTGMVRKLPSLLGFSVLTVLAPKYGYLVDVMNRSRDEVVRFPHYFSYSLRGRIVPRHQYLGQLCDSLSLNTLYGCSDLVFQEKARKWPKRMFQSKETDVMLK